VSNQSAMSRERFRDSTPSVQTLNHLFYHFVTHSVLRATKAKDRPSNPAIAQNCWQVATGLCSNDRHLSIGPSTDRTGYSKTQFCCDIANICSTCCRSEMPDPPRQPHQTRFGEKLHV